MRKSLTLVLLTVSLAGPAQVDTSYVYNTTRPYGTLDIRIAKSASRYYYLQEDRTISFRENSAGEKTNTYRNMTSWNSSPYSQGNLREKNGTADYFIMNYRLLFPVGYQPDYADGYPMIVMLHGAGERGNCWDSNCYWADRSWKPSSNNPAAPTSSGHNLLNNDHNLLHGGKQHLDARNLAGSRLPDDAAMPQRAFPGFVLFPQNLNGWDNGTAHDAIRLVRLLAKKYNVDPDRIYVHGLSNGGIATYNVIKRAPWLFAAALPMSAPTESAIINQGLVPEVAHIPIWTFQGGKDVAPEPSRTEGYVRKFREAGAEVKYSLYENLGHGTWNAAYGEPEFFRWMRSQSKNNIHVFFGNTSICGTTGEGVRLGLAAGFLAYQWEKDGAIIPGATGNEYEAAQPGVYRARFSRVSRTPGSTQWQDWSPPVTITGSGSAKADIIPLTTTHLRGPDDATPNTIHLKSASKADRYLWYKNGTLIDIPNNDMDDTVSIYTISGTSTGNNGAYTLRTAGFEGCTSAASDPFNLFFNNSAPLLADGNVPASFGVVSVTGSTAKLAWEDRSSVETGYEIWRRAPGESFVMAGRTEANAGTFTDVGLIPSTIYHYKIRALNNQGRSRYAPSDNVSTNLNVTTAEDTEAPSAPKNLKVTRNSTSSITLSWTAATDNYGIKHYIVYYGSQSRVTNSPETTYTITGLPINTSYSITVKAVDHAGLVSPASNQVTGTTSVSGLWYGHSTGAWTDLDQITNWDDPEITGWVPNFTLAPRTQDDYFNFDFNGYLFIKEPGNYYFYLNSDDGSRLFIDGNQVVDFDGVHGRSSQNEGFGVRSVSAIQLSAGPHEIRVIYFEYTGGQSLDVSYQGPDTDNQKMNIPDAALTSGEASGSTNKSPVVNIATPENNEQFTAPASISITATASDPDGSVTKVEFYNGTTKLGEDASSPYAYTWNNVSSGSYTIEVRVTDNDGATASASVDVLVTSGAACAGTGKITHEVWTGVSGTKVSSIPLTEEPDSTGDLTIFEIPSNTGDNYGTRVRGYICPPASGTYVFWITGDDQTELWLSTDEHPANKKKIAYVNGWTSVRQWTKYTTQESAPVTLAANQKYYIEALHKEGTGGDNMAVGWQLPGGTLERPIPGMRLIPFGGSSATPAPVVSITSPDDGATFTEPASINITANASFSEGTITKVEFYNGMTKLGEDNNSPYTYTWTNVSAGSYTLEARAIASDGSTASSSVNVSVSGGAGCEGAGSIVREVWTNISGTTVSSIPVSEPPHFTEELTIFEGPTNVADYYGARFRGYICAPVSGNYVFWVTGDDHSELWLSTDVDPANKQLIAYQKGWTTPRQWTKYASQQSVPIALSANQRYYIEALHKEAAGGDNVAVGWQLPDGTLERPIPGSRLIPFGAQTMMTSGFEAETMQSTSSSNMLSEEISTEMDVYPNPVESGTPELMIIGGDASEVGYKTTVEIQRLTGEVVYSSQFNCEGYCGETSIPVGNTLRPGVYLLNFSTNGKKSSKRLLVK